MHEMKLHQKNRRRDQKRIPQCKKLPIPQPEKYYCKGSDENTLSHAHAKSIRHSLLTGNLDTQPGEKKRKYSRQPQKQRDEKKTSSKNAGLFGIDIQHYQCPCEKREKRAYLQSQKIAPERHREDFSFNQGRFNLSIIIAVFGKPSKKILYLTKNRIFSC